MDEGTKKHRLDLFERICREQGVPFTVQRRVILETVLDLDDHPTADQVYDAVAHLLTGISRTTVYRTLETLVRLGVITKACHPGKPVRFDTRTEVHHHLVCLHCDDVVDIFDEHLDALTIPDTSAYGFKVSDFRVQLRGVCRRCSEKEGES
jgi:Fur family peroxide stress response transcriptional regulator